MFGVKFKLDEEKILKEKEYDLEKIYQAIEKIAILNARLKKISKNHYEFRAKKNLKYNSTNARLGFLIFNHLLAKDWFMKNIKTYEFFKL